jgi:hypothetical protein
VRSKKGRTYKGTGRFVVSNGGKTATLTTKGTGADGKPFTAVTVYEKCDGWGGFTRPRYGRPRWVPL